MFHFNTVLIQIESFLNDCTLTPLQLSQLMLTCKKYLYLNKNNRLQCLQKQHFWERWSLQYLHGQQNQMEILNSKPEKWTTVLSKQRNFSQQVETRNNHYVQPGKDGVVRMVKLKTQNGDIKRSVVIIDRYLI